MNILLLCSNGISSTIIQKRLENAAKRKNTAVKIHSDALQNIGYYIDQYDIVLIAPQMAGSYADVKKLYAEKEATILLMTQQQFTDISGDRLFDFISQEYQKKHANGKYLYDDEINQMQNYYQQAKKHLDRAMNHLANHKEMSAIQQLKDAKAALAPCQTIEEKLNNLQKENPARLDTTIAFVQIQSQIASLQSQISFTEQMIQILKSYH